MYNNNNNNYFTQNYYIDRPWILAHKYFQICMAVTKDIHKVRFLQVQLSTLIGKKWLQLLSKKKSELFLLSFFYGYKENKLLILFASQNLEKAE